MRYLAQQRLSVTLAGSEHTQVYMPGSVVADFDAWPEYAKRAAIATHQVAVDPTAVLEDGTCATCGQAVRDRPKKVHKS